MAFITTLTPTPAAGKGIPYTHMTAILGNTIDINTRAWTSYAPTWTNGTLGNGVLEGRFWQLGKLVVFRIDLIWGTTTSSSGAWQFTFPATAASTRAFIVCTGEYIDMGTTSGSVRGRLVSSTAFTVLSAAAQLSTTSPHTWASTDEMHLIGVYEAA